MNPFRLFPRDAVVRLHLIDDSTVEGRFLRKRRGFIHMTDGRIEADGKLRDAAGMLMVPRKLVKIVQVVG